MSNVYGKLTYRAQMENSKSAAKKAARVALHAAAARHGREIGPVRFLKEWSVDLGGPFKYFYCEAEADLK